MAAGAAVFPELDGILTLEEEQKSSLKSFSVWKTLFLSTPEWLWKELHKRGVVWRLAARLRCTVNAAPHNSGMPRALSSTSSNKSEWFAWMRWTKDSGGIDSSSNNLPSFASHFSNTVCGLFTRQMCEISARVGHLERLQHCQATWIWLEMLDS